MKALRRDAKVLKAKAISSFRRSAEAFNSYQDDGRVTAVLLHLQHAFEMLLKAGLVQHRIEVLDPKLGRSIGMEKCINLGRQHLQLSAPEAGLLRAIDALRDDEQHRSRLCRAVGQRSLCGVTGPGRGLVRPEASFGETPPREWPWRVGLNETSCHRGHLASLVSHKKPDQIR